jgi:hypothetical protein
VSTPCCIVNPQDTKTRVWETLTRSARHIAPAAHGCLKNSMSLSNITTRTQNVNGTPCALNVQVMCETDQRWNSSLSTQVDYTLKRLACDHTYFEVCWRLEIHITVFQTMTSCILVGGCQQFKGDIFSYFARSEDADSIYL